MSIDPEDIQTVAETVHARINDGHTPVAFDDAARALGFSPDEF